MNLPDYEASPDWPGEGQAQEVFDQNSSNVAAWFKAKADPYFKLLKPWVDGRRDEIAATALAGDLPDMAGKAGHLPVVNTDETAAAFFPANKPRNQVINGGFDVWQRGTSQVTNAMHSVDRWYQGHASGTKTASRQTFGLGQTDVPGNPKYFLRNIISASSTVSHFASSYTRLEDVTKLAGYEVTVTFWAKADVERTVAVSLDQSFGTGGAPDPMVNIPAQHVVITTQWTKYALIFQLPNIAGKTLGSDGNHYTQLLFWYSAGSDHDARTGSLGLQSGTFDLARVSLNVGDTTALADPFEPETYQQVYEKCCRYFQLLHHVRSYFYCRFNGEGKIDTFTFPIPMRSAPSMVNTTLSNTNVMAVNLVTVNAQKFDIYHRGNAVNSWSDYQWSGKLSSEL